MAPLSLQGIKYMARGLKFVSVWDALCEQYPNLKVLPGVSKSKHISASFCTWDSEVVGPFSGGNPLVCSWTFTPEMSVCPGESEGAELGLELAMSKLSVQSQEETSNTKQLLDQLPPVPTNVPVPQRTEHHERTKSQLA